MSCAVAAMRPDTTVFKAEALARAQEPFIVRLKRHGKAAYRSLRNLATHIQRPGIIGICLVLLIITSIFLFAPSGAYAAEAPDVNILDPKTWIDYFAWFFNDHILGEWVRGMFEEALVITRDIDADTIITAPFGELVDGSRAAVLTNAVENVSNTVIRPCANCILAMAVTLQLIKIAQKMDQGGGTLPALREVVVLFVVCAVMIYCVNHAAGLMEGVYDLFRRMTVAVNSTLGTSISYDTHVEWDFSKTDTGTVIVFLLMSLISFLVALLSYAGSMFMAMSRGLEIYLLTIFSPLPMALFGLDETKQWAWGYLRAFITVCLQGAVLIVILWFFPYVFSSIVDQSVSIVVGGDGTTEGLHWLIQFLVVNVVLFITVFKSGALAGKILGGA